MSTITETTTGSERAELASEFLMLNPLLRVLTSGADHVVVLVPGAASSFQLGRALYDTLQQFRTPNRVADLPFDDTRRAALLRSVRRLHASRVMVAPDAIGIAFSDTDRGVSVQECPFAEARHPRRVRQLTTSLALPGRSDWVLNPEASLRLVGDAGRPVIRSSAPVPGRGLQSSAIALDAERDTFTFLAGVMHGSPSSTPGPEAIAVLEAAGLVVRPDRMPVPVPFRLPAGDVADLIADGVVPGDPGSARPGDEQSLAACLTAEDASDDHRLVWCDDLRRGMRWPLWLTPAQVEEVRRLAPGLAQSAEGRGLARPWDDALAAVHGQVARDGFGIVRDLLPAAVVSGFAGYYRRLRDNGYLLAGDPQAQRDTLHNERAARWLHAHVRELVQRAIPEPVKCSYSYLGLYHPGASLARHTDRAQCEYTLSLTIDASPGRRRDEAWPLYLQPDGSAPVQVLLAPSDGALFKGRSIPHYREPLAAGRTSWSMFLHFVPVGFEGNLD